MIKTLRTLALVACASLSSMAMATMQTVTLDVPGMTCSSCPITVKKALTKVNGVQQVIASFEKREAVVTFDDTKTSVEKLSLATTDAGYPAKLKVAK